MGEQLELFGGDPSVLDEARSLIYGERQDDYGHPTKNLGDVGRLWDVFLDRRPPGPLSAAEVCSMMALLKMARLASNPGHRDSLVDAVGYLALAERCAR